VPRLFLFFLVIFLSTGCAERLETYIEEPATIIQDPHFAEYEKKQQALEHQYLQKEITYAQYLEKKGELEDQYTKEVDDRNKVIYGER